MDLVFDVEKHYISLSCSAHMLGTIMLRSAKAGVFLLLSSPCLLRFCFLRFYHLRFALLRSSYFLLLIFFPFLHCPWRWSDGIVPYMRNKGR